MPDCGKNQRMSMGMMEGKASPELGKPALTTPPILCVCGWQRRGSSHRQEDIAVGSVSLIHIPARANRGSGFPELAVTPRSRMSGCGKYESARENMNPCYGQGHCPEGLLIWVATVMQLEPLFRNRHFQCRLLLEVSVHIVLQLNENFFPVKFCFSDLKLNLPLLVWFFCL